MNKKLFIILLIAFVLRILLIFSAYHGDLNNNISWGTIAVEKGLSGFYGSADANDWPYSAPNQPPLSILMFAGLRVVWQVIENVSWWMNNRFRLFPSQFIWFWEQKGMILLIKLPGILADLGIGWIIYEYVGRQKTGERRRKSKLPLILTTVWLFNPITWYNSAIWGQTDSIVNLLGLISALSLLDKRLVLGFTFLVLSLLFKGSLAIFIPVWVLVAFLQKHSRKKWLCAAFYMLLTTVLVSFWFHPRLNLLSWLINLYKDRILPGEIGYLTANAFNLWWLVNPGRVPDSTLYFGISARVWGIGITLLGILGILGWLRKKKLSDKAVFLSLSITALITFLFMTRIHERYLYPFFPYATILLGFIPQLIIPYTILSVSHLFNLYHLFWAPPIGFIENLFVRPVFPLILSLINIFVFIYLLRLLRTSKI